jgi:hypothetical protein
MELLELGLIPENLPVVAIIFLPENTVAWYWYYPEDLPVVAIIILLDCWSWSHLLVVAMSSNPSLIPKNLPVVAIIILPETAEAESYLWRFSYDNNNLLTWNCWRLVWSHPWEVSSLKIFIW